MEILTSILIGSVIASVVNFVLFSSGKCPYTFKNLISKNIVKKIKQDGGIINLSTDAD